MIRLNYFICYPWCHLLGFLVWLVFLQLMCLKILICFAFIGWSIVLICTKWFVLKLLIWFPKRLIVILWFWSLIFFPCLPLNNLFPNSLFGIYNRFISICLKFNQTNFFANGYNAQSFFVDFSLSNLVWFFTIQSGLIFHYPIWSDFLLSNLVWFFIYLFQNIFLNSGIGT